MQYIIEKPPSQFCIALTSLDTSPPSSSDLSNTSPGIGFTSMGTCPVFSFSSDIVLLPPFSKIYLIHGLLSSFCFRAWSFFLSAPVFASLTLSLACACISICSILYIRTSSKLGGVPPPWASSSISGSLSGSSLGKLGYFTNYSTVAISNSEVLTCCCTVALISLNDTVSPSMVSLAIL